MNIRSAAKLLALSAATVVTIPVAVAPAHAAGTAQHRADVSDWGPFFSRNGKAKAVGTVDRTGTEITGQLFRLDRGRKCAHIEILFIDTRGNQSTDDERRCAGDLGIFSIKQLVPVKRVLIRVSQIDDQDHVFNRGAWHTIFNARRKRILVL
ncbi:hypothetical protein J5X84_37445 [Streptosporangiaceae bacterium NEAU-GS5]|nr:hypothetical protein [Streptosporangiaceae bacterium NEAU-GS5]